MNILLSILILFFASNVLISQTQVKFMSPQFDSNPPKWVYTVYDSTNIGYAIERRENYKTDGYNMVYNFKSPTWAPLIKDKYFYTAAISKGTTSHVFGSVVQKIDLETGMPVWTSIFDNRTIEKQEYVQQLKIIGAKTLKIITHRRIKDRFNDFLPESYNIQGDSSTICTREYSMNNGELLKWQWINPEENNVVYTLPHAKLRRTLFENKDGSYQFIQINTGTKKNIELYHLDENEKILNKYIDTFYYDKKKYNLDTLKIFTVDYSMFKPNEDTIVTLHVYATRKGGINIPELSYVTLYDRQLNRIKLISLEKLYSFHNDNVIFNLIKAWDDVILIQIRRKSDELSKYYMDYDGNILASFDSEDFKNEVIIYTTYLPASRKFMLLTFDKKSNGKFREDFKLNFYLYEEGKWNYKYFIDYAENHYVSSIYTIDEIMDNDLLMCVNHRYYDKVLDESSNSSETWMRVDGKQIGLVGTHKEFIQEKIFNIFPNPAKDILTIDFADDFSGKIKILDEFGRDVKTCSFKKSQKQDVDVSGLIPGLYFVRALDSEKQNVYNVGKFVKE